jgi:ABC-type multidrug transport system ATPase subunit
VGRSLHISGVWKSLGSREVLRGCDAELAPGTVAWVGGPNGAGKTTLLRVIAGILTPDRGEALLDGRAIGFLAAGDRSLHARLSVRANVAYAAGLAGLATADGAVDRALERFGLADASERRSDRLSVGQRQRVRLAAATVHDPGLLLLDEPYGSLDDEGSEQLQSVLREMAAAGGIAIWCSPASERGRLASDRSLHLEDGKLVEDA